MAATAWHGCRLAENNTPTNGSQKSRRQNRRSRFLQATAPNIRPAILTNCAEKISPVFAKLASPVTQTFCLNSPTPRATREQGGERAGDLARNHNPGSAGPAHGLVGKTCARPRETAWRLPDFRQSY